MGDINTKLEEKKGQLHQLRENQSKANCSVTISSAADMRREMEMENLEDEIKALEKQLAG